MKLAIGSVQFGMNYGVGKDTRPSLDEIKQILEVASAFAIDRIDTAPVYGEAQSILGRCNAARAFKIISKVPPIPSSVTPHQFVARMVEDSLLHLRCEKLEALLLHRAQDWCIAKVYRCLDNLRSDGIVRQIGISVYDLAEINMALEVARPDVIQLPLNVLDQRFVSKLTRLKELGIEIHVRSIFLQGLLLMPLEKIPRFFEPILPTLTQWRRFTRDQGLQPEEGALNFIGSVKGVDYAIVGVHCAEQLTQIARAFQRQKQLALTEFQPFAVNDYQQITPTFWPKDVTY